MATTPARYLPEIDHKDLAGDVVRIDLNRPMAEIRATLGRYPVRTRVALSGPMILVRRWSPRASWYCLISSTPVNSP